MNFRDCFAIYAKDRGYIVFGVLLGPAIVVSILLAIIFPDAGLIHILPFLAILIVSAAFVYVKSIDYCRKIVESIETGGFYVLKINSKKDSNLTKGLFLGKKTVYQCIESSLNREFDVYVDVVSELKIQVGDTFVFIDNPSAKNFIVYFRFHWIKIIPDNYKDKIDKLLNNSKNNYLNFDSFSRESE